MPARKPSHFTSPIEGLIPLYGGSVSVPTTAGGKTFSQLLNAAAADIALLSSIRAIISVAAACHLTFDGTAPTSTVGHPLAAGQTWILEGAEAINAAKLISDSGTITGYVTLEG